ncbi:unnamed protein product [Diamesa serratosioi]
MAFADFNITENTCRICLTASDQLTDISNNFISVEKKLILMENLMKNVGLQKSENSSISLPNRICKDCKTTLVEFYMLKKNFQENEACLFGTLNEPVKSEVSFQSENLRDIIEIERSKEYIVKNKINTYVDEFILEHVNDSLVINKYNDKITISERQLFNCRKCGRLYSTRFGKNKHEKHCNGINTDGCNSWGLEKLKVNVHDRAFNQFICPSCNKTFTKLKIFHKHKRMCRRNSDTFVAEEQISSDIQDEIEIQVSSNELLEEQNIFEITSSKDDENEKQVEEYISDIEYMIDDTPNIDFLESEEDTTIVCTDISEPLYNCIKCQKKFKSSYYLKTHILKCRGFQNVSKFTCTLCDKGFSSRSGRDTHVQLKHTYEAIFENMHPGSLNDHEIDVVLENGNLARAWRCPQCMKISNKKDNHKKHLIRHTIRGIEGKCVVVLSGDEEEIDQIIEAHKEDILDEEFDNSLISFEDTEDTGYSIRSLRRIQTSISDITEHSIFVQIGDEEPQKAYKCPICDQISSCEKTHKAHTNHHQQKIRSKGNLNLENIVQSIDDNGKDFYSCFKCMSVFSERYEADYHYAKYGRVDRCLKCICKECNVVFESEKLYVRHKSFHTMIAITDHMNYFECTPCNLVFCTETELLKHKKLHDDPKFVYHGIFKNILDGAEQLFTTLTEETIEKSNCCGHCDRRFIVKSDLILHLMSFHAETLECPFDKQEFQKPFTFFVDHMKTKHIEYFNGSNVEFPCPYCENVFVTKYDMLSHCRNECKGKTFQCQHCDKKFGLDRQLKAHMKAVTSLHRYQCIECGKLCTTQSDLKTHSRIHSGERPFICTVCNKAFRTNSHRAGHMETHSNKKEHKCKFCDQFFKTRGAMRSHEKSHDRDKNICNICGKDFRNNSHLRRHLKGVHRVNDADTVICNSIINTDLNEVLDNDVF